MKYTHVIGVDTGTNTGIAVWSTKDKAFDYFGTIKIHEALFMIRDLAEDTDKNILVRVEDARKRGNSSKMANAMAQGVGSVKRDASIFEDFLMEYKIDYHLLRPSKTTTKMSVQEFAKFTGITTRTSNHCRDACMLVFKFN
jgi:hypothetical protein